MNRKMDFGPSALPSSGGGQMYQGYMKRGLSLMSMFMFVIFLSAFLGMGLLSLMLPVIWAYSFFDTFNIHSQTPSRPPRTPTIISLTSAASWAKTAAACCPAAATS